MAQPFGSYISPVPPVYDTTSSTRLSQIDMSAVSDMIQRFDRVKLLNMQEDDIQFNNFISDLPQVKDLQPTKDSIVTNNKSLAQSNLSLKPVYEKAKAALSAAHEELSHARETTVETQTLLASTTTDLRSSDALVAVMETEVQKTEEESEELLQEFFDGSMNISEFLEKFITTRALYHSRHFKVGKLKQLTQPSVGPQVTIPKHYPPWYTSPPYPTM